MMGSEIGPEPAAGIEFEPVPGTAGIVEIVELAVEETVLLWVVATHWHLFSVLKASSASSSSPL